MIPSDYVSWRHCIEIECGITLTADFIKKRIEVLQDPKNPETVRFTECYGDEHRLRVLGFFQRALKDV
jgi:hypothetical protein